MKLPVKPPKAPRAAKPPKAAQPKAPKAARPPRAKTPGVSNANWIANLQMWQKLALIPAILLIPLSVLLFFLVSNQNEEITFTQSEIRGAQYLEATVPLLELSVTLRHTTSKQSMDVDFIAKAFEQNLQRLVEVHGRLGATLQVEGEFNAVQSQWNSTKGRLNERGISTEVLLLTTALRNLIERVADTSKLVLDPDADSYYLMTMAVDTLPQLVFATGENQLLGTRTIAEGRYTLEQRLQLQNLMARSAILFDKTEEAYNKALQANPGLSESISQPFAQASSQFTNSFLATQLMSLTGKRAGFLAAEYDAQLELAKVSFGYLYAEAAVQLNRLLEARLGRLQNEQRTTLALALMALMLSAFIVFAVARTITRPIDNLLEASQRLGQGQFDLELRLKGQDELGQLAAGLQAAANQLQQNSAQQEAERVKGQQLQDNVNKFLTVATEIAQGDFTRRGDVTDDVLGNVVDAINLMTEEVSYLLRDVQQAADSVSNNAQQVNGLTDSIAQGAQTQAEEVQQVRERTLQAAETIRQMAERAAQSVQQAQQTLEAAQLGREAVVETLAGMQDIRMEMQGIAENIRAFLVRSAEINSIAKTLEDFASQTNLLALNASFEAAGAGAAGKRFAVVAEEIRRLAESSAREVGRVGTLVQQIQTEIGAVVSRTQDGVREVENSYRIANTADERLEEIARLAGRTTQAAEQISKLAEGQVAVVERVEEAVQKIAQTAQRSEAESAQGREAAEVMRRLSEQLSGNLGRFKLPG